MIAVLLLVDIVHLRSLKLYQAPTSLVTTRKSNEQRETSSKLEFLKPRLETHWLERS